MLAWLQGFTTHASSILLEAGFWVLVSLLAAGVVQAFADSARWRRLMHAPGPASYGGALGLGAVLPMCSCGVIPLALGFRHAGMRLGAVMTFAAATPVINPAAVLLSFALLGPELTAAYIAFGLTAPLLVGLLVERLAGRDAASPLPQRDAPTDSCCAAAQAAPPSLTLGARLVQGLRWGLGTLGPKLGLYLGIGILLAALVLSLTPDHWVPEYLGGASPLLSLFLVALLGASIYVCAVAHIPVVAALLAAGASPGIAIVFLVTGAVSNLPELVALQRVLGTRVVAVYAGGLIALSIGAGWLVNRWLLPAGWAPVDPLQSLVWSDRAAQWTPIIAEPLALVGAAVVAALGLWGLVAWGRQRLAALRTKRTTASAVAGEGCCKEL